MARITLSNVCMRYEASDVPAVRDLSLEIEDGELFVLLGPSGCGKSTLLKLLAGLEVPSGGEIYFDDEFVNFRTAGQRNVAMVFQSYALYPHMTVAANIDFPLKMRRTDKQDRREAVERATQALELESLKHRQVAQLSGGQRQRVALARAIVRNPRLMLMDEPLSNLDALLRMQTREELLRLHREVGGTTIYVTHDQTEAMAMGDRIGVMREGELVQVASPMEVYGAPSHRFVAEFIGTPPMNTLAGSLVREGGKTCWVGPGLRVQVDERFEARADVTLGVRPEGVQLRRDEATNPWTVELVEHFGSESIVLLRHEDSVLRAREFSAGGTVMGVQVGDRLTVEIAPDAAHLFDEDGARLEVRAVDEARRPALPAC